MRFFFFRTQTTIEFLRHLGIDELVLFNCRLDYEGRGSSES